MIKSAPMIVLIGLFQLFFVVGCTDKLQPIDTGEPIDGEVIGILISPEKVILPLGESVQLVATGLMDNRTSRDLTPYVTWMTANGSVASVSNSLDSEGLLTGASVGSTKIRAHYEEVFSVDVDVEVTEASLVGLAIEPKEITVQEGQEVS